MSAQRFGGKYSTGGASTAPPPQAPRGKGPAGAGWLVAVAGLPLVLTAFSADGTAGFALSLAALFAFLAAGFLVREGARAQAAFEARSTARPPAFPRKLFGSVLAGVGLALAVLSDGGALVSAVGIGVIGALLGVVAFGIDPMRSKGIDETNAYATDRAARAVEDAEALIAEIEALARPVAARELRAEVAAFTQSARAMCAAILDDPRDLTRARRYVGIYLEGARDATKRFAALPAAARDAAATAKYRALLRDLREGYEKRREDLLVDDRDALDVEVDVLRDRLARDMAAG